MFSKQDKKKDKSWFSRIGLKIYKLKKKVNFIKVIFIKSLGEITPES